MRSYPSPQPHDCGFFVGVNNRPRGRVEAQAPNWLSSIVLVMAFVAVVVWLV